MDFIREIWNKSKRLDKTIVLPETEDARVLKASELIQKSKLAKIILVGKEDEVRKKAQEAGADISGTPIIYPRDFPKLDKYVQILKEKRAHRGMTIEKARHLMVDDYPYFAAMLVSQGATVNCIGKGAGQSIISSFFVMILNDKKFGEDGLLFFADCGVVPNPETEQLADIALQTAASFKKLIDRTPRVAMLSFSTKTSAVHEDVDKVIKATEIAKKKNTEVLLDGELQLDAALIQNVAQRKAPGSRVAGQANVLIFPDLDAGNIKPLALSSRAKPSPSMTSRAAATLMILSTSWQLLPSKLNNMSNAQSPKSILESILKKDIDQAEVFMASSKTLKIDVLNQRVESIDEIDEIGCGIRVIKDKKLGFAFTSDLDETLIEETIDQAIENAKNSGKDEFLGLPNSAVVQGKSGAGLFDNKISETPIQKKIETALKVEDTAYKAEKRVKKTEKVSYEDSESEVWIVNSKGVAVNYKINFCGADAGVIAVQDNEMQMGFGIDFVKKIDDLAPVKIGKEAAQRATQLLGAKSIPSQKIPLVIDPFVGTQILGVLAAPLSSDSVQKGKSLFLDKIGKVIGSKSLTIIDNGKLENGLGTAPFDGEGVPTQETNLIESGILNTFLFNTYTANKGNAKSTGNAARGSFQTLPTVGPSNLYIKAGSKPADEIIKSIKKGLYVTRVMGIHTANPISGDFSFGAMGIMIENGEKTYPVRGITIAGNLIEMLKAIEAVGSDLRFIADIGSPTLLISGISVSGH
jgi:PmbA protein